MSQKKAGVALTYLTQAVQLLSALVYTPIMLRLLGQSEYGLYQLVNSVVGYLGLLSFGFSSSYLRFYARLRAEGDEDGVAGLNGLFMTVFILVAIVCVACGSVMVANVRAIFADGLTEAEYPTATVLMALMVVNLALTFPNSVFDCYTTACERFVFQRMLGLLRALLNPFITLPLLLMGYGSIGMVLVSTGLTVAALAVNGWYSLRRLGMRFRFRDLDGRLFREIFAFSAFVFLNSIIDQLNWQIDKFILGRVSGTREVAVYGVGSQFNTYVVMLSSAVSAVFAPQVNMIAATCGEERLAKLSALLARVGRIQFIVVLPVVLGFIMCGMPFVEWWAGPEYSKSYYVAILLIAPLVVILPHSLGIEIRRAENKHQLAAVIMLATALGNLAISVPLAQAYGAVGSALGTFASLVVNTVFIDVYYVRVVGLDVLMLYKNLLALAVAGIPAALISVLGRGMSGSMLAGFVAIFVLVYAVFMYCWGMDESERSLFGGVTRRILPKVKDD